MYTLHLSQRNCMVNSLNSFQSLDFLLSIARNRRLFITRYTCFNIRLPRLRSVLWQKKVKLLTIDNVHHIKITKNETTIFLCLSVSNHWHCELSVACLYFSDCSNIFLSHLFRFIIELIQNCCLMASRNFHTNSNPLASLKLYRRAN